MIRRTSINVVMLAAICIFFSVLIALAGVTKENGIDRPGSDYSQIFLQSPDPKHCADLCAGDPNCKAYTYTKPGIDGPQAHCWLKNAVPNPVPNKNCISGVKTSITQEKGIDRPGSDYSQIFLQSPDPKHCANLCVGDPNCKAYTYTKPGIDGPQAHCWLKNAVPNPVPNKNCISGAKV